MVDFAHLHLHTEYSLLDGMGRIGQYIDRAQALGMQHMAVTDHGVMYAAMDWYTSATKAGIHPIIGMEAYLAEGPASRRERKSYHLLLLAENDTGYRNLLQLASKAALHGFYYRPRIDMEMLQEHREGIIATSACLGGPVANNFLHHQPEKAVEYAQALTDIFGQERFFIELQDHGLKEQLDVNKQLIPLARKMNLPLVATNDVHYCCEEDAPAQDVLVCVQTNTTINDSKRLKQESEQFFLKSPGEMAALFDEVPESITNTIRIAEMCNLDLGFKGYHLPEYDVPDGTTTDRYLRQLCEDGARRHYGTLEGEIGTRLDYELSVIASMGFTNYFLIVWDFVNFAKQNGILVGPGRGSAAGSLVTYCLGITGLDPLKYGLIFERFLNPSRISMPDIDIDFADDRRGEVIDYVVQKYGDDRVAQIVTFGTLKAKAAVRDVGRAMGLSFGETDRVARLIPTDPKMTIDKALGDVPELSKIYEGEAPVRDLIDTARKVEGLARHSSTHAAGVVISPDSLVHHVPLQRAGGKSEGDITTQWAQNHLEDLGLLKMDFLGLKTLTVLGRAVELARRSGSNITLEEIPMENEVAFELLKRGETFGVFQLEGGMTTRMTIDVAPESFEDLIALMALIRPGPMELAPDYIARKHGRVETEYQHPLLKDVLEETYGIALYQEQVMQIANVLSGFSMAEADGLRKAMGKKLADEMAKYRDRFISGAKSTNNIEKKLAADIFDTIERFAGYGFNKSHSAAYAVIAAQTAYMKANHPVEFMAALMSTEMGNTEKTVYNVSECRRAGVAVLPPDITRSGVEFSVETLEDGKKAVRFGLGAVKNVGVGAISAIVNARDQSDSGQLASLDAFCDAVDWSSTNKRVIESLTKAGALDVYGHRAAVLAGLEQAAAAAQKRQKAAARGQMDLFGLMVSDGVVVEGPSRLPEVPAAESRQILEWEKEFLGLYLSSHPLIAIIGDGLPDDYTQVVEVSERFLNDRVRLVGMVKGVRRITTKTSKTMAIIEVEDLTGTIEMVAFPETFEKICDELEDDAILLFTGKVDERGEKRQIIIESASSSLPELNVKPKSRLTVMIELPLCGDYWEDVSLMHKVDEVLRVNSGDAEVAFLVPHGGKVTRLRSRSRKITWTPEVAEELEAVLGGNRAKIVQSLPNGSGPLLREAQEEREAVVV
ncbi:MAG TPA: DNA polymerase III subunit alpha [Thermomicrobiales bacterium]|nr:DNA polymerase III subunit alpha [Thermomicrobiales bacterium]